MQQDHKEITYSKQNQSGFFAEHGGDIEGAAAHFGIPLAEWIDLSTGMNPEPYPVEALAVEVFHKLPYQSQSFIESSARYYGSEQFVAVAGSQAAIQWLPQLLADLPVLLPSVGYRDHYEYWHQRHSVDFYDSLDASVAAEEISDRLSQNSRQHLLVINPNNPSGIQFSIQQIIEWSGMLSGRAFVIVDEAFIDTCVGESLLNLKLPNNIVVLRSFGKFFGLAGIRLGYVFANDSLLARFRQCLTCWQINGPAQAVAIKALSDEVWQKAAQQSIQHNVAHTAVIFEPLWPALGIISCTVNSLFISVVMSAEAAAGLYQFFARSGVLLRLVSIDHRSIIRIGLLSRNDKIACGKLSQLVEDYLALVGSRVSV